MKYYKTGTSIFSKKLFWEYGLSCVHLTFIGSVVYYKNHIFHNEKGPAFNYYKQKQYYLDGVKFANENDISNNKLWRKNHHKYLKLLTFI